MDAERNLANPIGGKLREGVRGNVRHPCAPPPREIGNENVRGQVNLGLIQNDPSAWSASSTVKGTPQVGAESGGDFGVWQRRTWMRVEHPEQDLTHDIRGQRFDVGVGRRRGCGLRRHLPYLSAVFWRSTLWW